MPFWKKNHVRLQTKERKKSTLVSYGRKWFGNFLSDSKKKKKKVLDLRIFIVSVIQSTPGIYKFCSRASYLRMYISPPLRLQGLIDFD